MTDAERPLSELSDDDLADYGNEATLRADTLLQLGEEQAGGLTGAQWIEKDEMLAREEAVVAEQTRRRRDQAILDVATEFYEEG